MKDKLILNLDNVTVQTEQNTADIDYILMMTEV